MKSEFVVVPILITTSQKRRLTHLWVCRLLIFFTTNLRYSLNNVLHKSTIDSPQTQLNHGFRCSTRSRQPQDELIIRSYKPIGAAPQGHFFVVGGGGVWAKKVVTLRGLRISEKKEILRKPTVL
jgi:hypothetical protein